MDIKPPPIRPSKHPLALPSSRPVKREDAQPNETSSFLPHRLRRPAEPPAIRPAASHVNLIQHSPHSHHRHHPHHSNKPWCKDPFHRASPSYYRPNYSSDPPLRRPPRPSEQPCDPYRFRRHSAYENSHLGLNSSLSSSNPHSSYRSNLEFNKHFHLNSSNFSPVRECSVSASLRKCHVNSETCSIQPSSHCPSPAPDHLDPSDLKHQVVGPSTFIPQSNECMMRTHSEEPCAAERAPIAFQVDPIPHPPRRPASPVSHFEGDQDPSPPFKKRKVSDPDRVRPSRHHSSAEYSSSHESHHASQKSPPQVELDPSKHNALTYEPSSTVLARTIVTSQSVRQGVVNLMYDLLEHLGPISDVRLDDFIQSKKCIKIVLSITFQHSSAAIRARWERSFRVPHPYLHKGNQLVISPKLSGAEKSAFSHLLPPCANLRPRNRPASSHTQAFVSQDLSHNSSIGSHPSAPKPTQDQDIDMLSMSNDNNPEEGDQPQSRCSSQLDMCSQSPAMIHSSSKKINETDRQPNEHSRGRSLVFAQPSGDSCQSPNPQAATTCNKACNLKSSKLGVSPPPISHRSILARTHLNKEMTRPASIQMILGILGRVGQIADVIIHDFSPSKKAIYLCCTVIFDQVHMAQKALLKKRYFLSPPYAHNGNRLMVYPKKPTIEKVPTDLEPVTPLDPTPPSSHHTDPLPARQKLPLQHSEIPDVKPKASLISDQNKDLTRPKSPKKLILTDDSRLQSIKSGLSSSERNDLESVVSMSEANSESSHQEDHQSSEEIPLWNTKPHKQVSDLLRSDSPNRGPDCPDSAEGPLHHDRVKRLPSGNCDNEANQLVTCNPGTSRSAEVCPKVLWVKGHFLHKVKNKKIEGFVRKLFKPFGQIVTLKVVRKKVGVCDLNVTYEDPAIAEQALKSLHGATVPPKLAFSKTRPYYLHVSFDYSPDAGCLAIGNFKKSKSGASTPSIANELSQEQDTRSEPLNSAPAISRSASDASDSVHSSRCSSRLVDVNEYTNSPKVTLAQNLVDPYPASLTATTNNQTDQDCDVTQLEPVPTQLGLPLRVVKYPFPPTCQESHPSHVSNRLHFKLEKIRLLSTQNETVLDSSWDVQYLILHVVTKSENSSLPFRVQPPVESNPLDTPPPNASSNLKITAPHSKIDEFDHSKQNGQVTSPLVVSETPSSIFTISISKHRTWPFDPLPIFLDHSVFPDFPKTLNDFLATFFRLWEESRSDLQCLYDPSAVFSNILAKQGRKPLAITKSTGWSSIYKSISRLPALSNEPMSDLIVDACPYSLNPPRVVCSIHGSFSEFPKAIKRAFDRTLILRPVDTRLHPSEGCLGLLKWITLSDTLTIRKHSTRTEAIVEGFMEKRNTSAYTTITSEGNLARQAFEENLRTQLSGIEVDVRARSTSSHAPTRSTHSPTRVSSPLQKVDVYAHSPGDNANETTNHHEQDPTTQTAVIPQSFEQPTGDLAQMQSQLRAMQAEIQHLKSLAEKPSPLNYTSQEEGRMIFLKNKSQTSHSAQNDTFRVVNSTSCSHVGFGVSSKRLILPTNLSRYLVISMRGDILTWDHTYPDISTQVQLILSGASPTDIVDSATYSNLSQTLIVGCRPSKSAKNVQTSGVRLVKLQKSSSNDNLICQRINLEDQHFENGVRALTLSPNKMNETDSTTSFLTAGQEKFISLWKVTHSNNNNSFKKIKHSHTDILKIHTDHTSVIQALAVDHTRQWVLSGGQDGKVYVTDLGQSNHQTLFSEEKNHIFDIQTNPVVQDTVMITTGNKAPGSQFRYCDLRMTKPVISFGLAPNVYGNIESPIKYQRKGSLRDYLFSYPNGEKGGVLVWDLRYPTVPSSSLNTSNGIGVQTHFESMSSIVVLEKEHLTRSEFIF